MVLLPFLCIRLLIGIMFAQVCFATDGSDLYPDGITDTETRGLDFVVGTHRRTDFVRYVLGSVTDSLVRTSPIPVWRARVPDPDT
nr:universal stress protein [Halorientalis salina]